MHGFVDNMADWLRCADIVVGKAGPGTIAEALCCATPLVLTSHLPGQEEGNAEFVVQAGAGSYAPGHATWPRRSHACGTTRPRWPPCARRRPGLAGPAPLPTSPA